MTRAGETAILIKHNKEGTVSSSPPAEGEGVNMESNHRFAVLLCRVAEPFGSVFLCSVCLKEVRLYQRKREGPSDQ